MVIAGLVLGLIGLLVIVGMGSMLAAEGFKYLRGLHWSRNPLDDLAGPSMPDQEYHQKIGGGSIHLYGVSFIGFGLLIALLVVIALVVQLRLDGGALY